MALSGQLKCVIHLYLALSKIILMEVVRNFLDSANSCWCCWRFVGLQEAQAEDQYGFETCSSNSIDPKGERNHARGPHSTSWRNVFLELVEKMASARKTCLTCHDFPCILFFLLLEHLKLSASQEATLSMSFCLGVFELVIPNRDYTFS